MEKEIQTWETINPDGTKSLTNYNPNLEHQKCLNKIQKLKKEVFKNQINMKRLTTRIKELNMVIGYVYNKLNCKYIKLHNKSKEQIIEKFALGEDSAQ